MTDLISRQAAIDAVGDVHPLDYNSVAIVERLKNLPSAEPEIIRCEDCIHWSENNMCERPELSGNKWHDSRYFETYPDDYCSFGER